MAASLVVNRIFALSRLSGSNQNIVAGQCARQIHGGCPLLFRLSQTLDAEPIKRKKKVDAGIVRLREERKKRKLEKEIRKLEKVGKKLKPIDELEVPPKLLHERKIRERKLSPLSEDEEDYRSWLHKEWCNYKRQQINAERAMIDRMMETQLKALEELKIISEELYVEAIQPDPIMLTGYKVDGPVYTPPIKNYMGLDGDYTDITKKWE